MAENDAVPGPGSVVCHRCKAAVGPLDQYCLRCGLYEPQRTCRFDEVMGVGFGGALGVALVSHLGFVFVCGTDRAPEIEDTVVKLAGLAWLGIILPTALVSYGLERFNFHRKKNRRA